MMGLERSFWTDVRPTDRRKLHSRPQNGEKSPLFRVGDLSLPGQSKFHLFVSLMKGSNSSGIPGLNTETAYKGHCLVQHRKVCWRLARSKADLGGLEI